MSIPAISTRALTVNILRPTTPELLSKAALAPMNSSARASAVARPAWALRDRTSTLVPSAAAIRAVLATEQTASAVPLISAQTPDMAVMARTVSPIPLIPAVVSAARHPVHTRPGPSQDMAVATPALILVPTAAHRRLRRVLTPQQVIRTRPPTQAPAPVLATVVTTRPDRALTAIPGTRHHTPEQCYPGTSRRSE